MRQKKYPDTLKKSFLRFSLRVFDTGIEDGTLDFIARKIILVDDLIIGEEVNLCLVEFLPGQDLFSSCHKVIERLGSV